MNYEKQCNFRKKHSPLYFLRSEVEIIFSLSVEIVHSENIWYMRNNNHGVTFCKMIVAYNCIVQVKRNERISKIEIMDLVI